MFTHHVLLLLLAEHIHPHQGCHVEEALQTGLADNASVSAVQPGSGHVKRNGVYHLHSCLHAR